MVRIVTSTLYTIQYDNKKELTKNKVHINVGRKENPWSETKKEKR
jgi:hypothetical protein